MDDLDRSKETKRTILLLGGTGFIGTNLACALVGAGHRVLATGRCRTSCAAGVPVFPLPLDEVDAVMALVGKHHIDTVVHLASSMVPSSSEAQYLAEQNAITLPTKQLAARLADLDVGLVYLSSGGTVYGLTSRTLTGEEDPCAPISFYGQSKLETELYLAFLHRTRGLRYLIVRPSNPFGPHQSLQGAQGLVSVILGRMREGRGLDVWGDGSSVRDYIYIDDLTTSLRQLIESDRWNTVINVGSGVGHSLLEVVRVVQQATGRQIALNFKPARAVDVPRLVLNIERLRGWGMDHARPLEDGIRIYAASLGMVDD